MMVTLVWLKSMSVLITHSYFGPLLRMIYLITLICARFLFVYFCLVLVYCAVMTSLFNDNEGYAYGSFAGSARTLFAACLAHFNIYEFEDDANGEPNPTYLRIIMTVFIMKYILIGVNFVFDVVITVTFLNLYIAILSNIYGEIEDRAEAEHRAVIISYYNMWSWNDEYGFLIYLPPPFNLLSLLLTPCLLLSKEHKKLNYQLCKFFYVIFAVF